MRERTLVRPVALLLAALLTVAAGACSKKGGGPSSGGGPSAKAGGAGDSIFLLDAPAFVPEEIDARIAAMNVDVILVPTRAIDASGAIKPLLLPPVPIARPIVLAFVGEPGAETAVTGASAESNGDAWGQEAARAVEEAKAFGKVVGVHVHIVPGTSPEEVKSLATAMRKLKSRIPGRRLSVTVPSAAPPATWAALEDAVDEVVVLAYGRRPETRYRFQPELTPEAALEFPLPFRVGLAPGGYGQLGPAEAPLDQYVPDLQIDKLSEDRGLDFNFGDVTKVTAGSSYVFVPKPGAETPSVQLASSGGRATFQLLTIRDLVASLSTTGKITSPKFRGRVFLFDALPTGEHLTGFLAVEAIMTGKPLEVPLEITAEATPAGKLHEVTLEVKYPGSVPTELTHYDNYVTIRVEGGLFVHARTGDFDRFAFLATTDDKAESIPMPRSKVLRLFENLFVPGEENAVGPITLSHAYGGAAKIEIWASSRIFTMDGKTVRSPETLLATIEPPAQPAPAPKRKLRR